jgi:hypothetical protein
MGGRTIRLVTLASANVDHRPRAGASRWSGHQHVPCNWTVSRGRAAASRTAHSPIPVAPEATIEPWGSSLLAAVNFTSPLKFLGLDDAGWERLKRRAQWDRLNVSEARALRLLNFIANDFSDPAKAALETLAEDGRLAAFVDEFKSIVATNGGYIVAKCAFQMISKSQQVARKLDDIAFQLTEKMRNFSEEMAAEMRKS